MFPSTVVGKIISTNVIERLKKKKNGIWIKKINKSSRFSINISHFSNNNTNTYL